MASTPVLVQTPKATPLQFTSSYTANTKTDWVTAGSSPGTKVVGLFASSTETANARIVQIWFTRSSTAYLIGSVNIPFNSGSDGATPNVNLLSLIYGLPLDNDGQLYLFLENGDKLQASLTTQPASGKEVDLLAVFGNFV